jgi:hypothetical protein
MKNMHTKIVYLAAGILLINCILPVVAQTSTTQSTVDSNYGTKHKHVDGNYSKKHRHGKGQYQTTNLSSAPSLPYLPTPPGTFVRAQEYTQLGNENCCVMQFKLSSTPEAIIQWYQQALTAKGWSINPTKVKPQFLTAERRADDLIVTIRSQPAATTAGQSIATIRYLKTTVAK